MPEKKQPARIKIEMNWEDAAGNAVKKGKPEGGWPKPTPMPQRAKKKKKKKPTK